MEICINARMAKTFYDINQHLFDNDKLINEIKKGQSVKYLSELENIIKNNEEEPLSLLEDEELSQNLSI